MTVFNVAGYLRGKAQMTGDLLLPHEDKYYSK